MSLIQPLSLPVDNFSDGTQFPAYRFLALDTYNLTPIHQGTFSEVLRFERTKGTNKNFLPIHTVEWWSPQYGWISNLPTISGNSTRGRLRRYATAILLNTLITAYPNHPGTARLVRLLDPKAVLDSADQQLLQLLMAGGSLGTSVKPNDATSSTNATQEQAPKQVWALPNDLPLPYLEQVFPMFSLFGYSNGDTKMRPGQVAVTDLIPIFAETLFQLAQWPEWMDHLDPTTTYPSWTQLTQDGQNVRFPRAFHARANPLQLRAQPEHSAESETSDMSQMFFIQEYLPANQRLLGGIYVHPSITMIELGLLSLAIRALQTDGFLGGSRSRGYGRVRWTPTTFPDQTDAEAAWHEHVARMGPTMLEMLGTLMQLRDSNARAKPAKPKNSRRTAALPQPSEQAPATDAGANL